MCALVSRGGAVLCGSLAVLALSAVATAQSGPPPRPTFVPAACPHDARVAPGVDGSAVTCGYVRVVQDRETPGSKLAPVQLPVLIYRTKTARDGVPVFFLAGGPGESAISVVAQTFLATPIGQLLAREHPIIAFNQRGFGAQLNGTNPDLGVLAYRWRSTRDESVGALADSARLVAKRFRKKGIDLRNFTTVRAIDDLPDVASALGYQKVILFGASYGTRMALQVMRKHPEIVTSAILDGVAPPSHTGLFDPKSLDERRRAVAAKVLEDCWQAPTCREEYGDLRTLAATIASPEAPPRHLIVNLSSTGWTSIEVSGRDILSALGAYASTGLTRAVLPQILDDLGRSDTLRRPMSPQFVMQVVYSLAVSRAAGPHYPVVYHVVLCGDDPEGAVQVGGRKVCDALGVPFEGPDAVAVVHSDVPTLLLTGAYDAQTPPELADEAARTLRTAYHVTFPGIGHLAFVRPTSASCVALISYAFLIDPSRRPPDGCAPAVVPAFLPRSANPDS